MEQTVDIDEQDDASPYEAQPETCYERDPDLPDRPTDAPDEDESGLESVRPWRVAEALKALKDQVNAAAPRRKTISDGSIGDAAHASRNSDHNPWVIEAGLGVVTAIDITHDSAGGCDSYRLADVLRKSHDPRIKYIISNSRIASAAPHGNVPAWAWRAYAGINPHNHHCHISVQPTKAQYDSRAKWSIADAFGTPRLDYVFDKALESTPSDTGGGEDATAGIELALDALAADSRDRTQPLLPRLLALSEAAGVLVSRYNETLRGDGQDAGGDGGEAALEATAPRFEDLADEYRRLFASCVIPADKTGVVGWHRMMLLKGRSRYREVEAKTGVPWWFVGIVHALEGSFNFAGHLHNGDPLAARTTHIPAGRPKVWNPPSDWLSSALDAMAGYAGQADWSLARALYRWEAYNGFGTRGRGLNSPYLWSFSNHYSKGKFVRDRVWDPDAVSKQCGAAVMLKALQDAGDVTI